MRALVVGILWLAACKPEIGYETYLCGVERDCPDGQECNGTDNRCVASANAEHFACDPSAEHEPDDSFAQAFGLPQMACISVPVHAMGCLHEGESEDWLKFTVPMDCAVSPIVKMNIAYPLAFEDVQLEIGDDAGVILEGETECDAGDTDLTDHGILQKCLKRTVTAGSTYTIHVKADGTLSCGGDCAYNRYTLAVRLQTP